MSSKGAKCHCRLKNLFGYCASLLTRPFDFDRSSPCFARSETQSLDRLLRCPFLVSLLYFNRIKWAPTSIHP